MADPVPTADQYVRIVARELWSVLVLGVTAATSAVGFAASRVIEWPSWVWVLILVPAVLVAQWRAWVSMRAERNGLHDHLARVLTARLLRDLGADVIAVDRDVPESTWSEVVVGTHELLANHPARSLLVVMPYRPRSEVIVKAYPGRRIVVCTQGAYPNLQMIGDDEQVLASALHSAGWDAVESISLPDPVDPSMAAHIFGR